MRLISTLCILFISVVCYSRINNNFTVFAGENLITLPFKMKNSCFYVCGSVRHYSLNRDSSGYKIIRPTSRCCYFVSEDPLIVLDGIPLLTDPGDSLNKTSLIVNINNIKSVEILKYAPAAVLYGNEAFNGVIIITTKNSKLRKFIIKDSLDGSLIAGATVSFISLKDRNERFQFAADDSGVVATDKLIRSSGYQMTVSAVGYQIQEEVFENNYNTSAKKILLSREIKTCPEVVVATTNCWRKLKCYGYSIRIIKTGGTHDVDHGKESFKVFPNPVSKGGTLNLEFNHDNGMNKMIRVAGLDGKIILQQMLSPNKGKNVLQLPTDPRWSAGIYFVQILYENGRIAASEKIIIQ